MSEKTPTPALNAAIAKLQGTLPRVTKGMSANLTKKDGTPGPKYKYADLADVSEAILPLLSQCGLAFTAMPDVDNGMFGLRYALRHESGEEDGGFYMLPDPRNTTPQQVGSHITYARRYSLCAATGVAPDGDDDDAKAAQDGFRSTGDMFDSAAPQPPQGERQWKPRQQQAQPAPAGNGAPEGEGERVAAYFARLEKAQSVAGCMELITEVGKAIRDHSVSVPAGNDLVAAIQKRKAEIRGAA